MYLFGLALLASVVAIKYLLFLSNFYRPAESDKIELFEILCIEGAFFDTLKASLISFCIISTFFMLIIVNLKLSEKLLFEWIFSFSSLNFFLAVAFGWKPYNFITSDHNLVEKSRIPKRNLPKNAIKIFFVFTAILTIIFMIVGPQAVVPFEKMFYISMLISLVLASLSILIIQLKSRKL